MAFHHGTIRKYTAALIDLFNNIEVQYDDSAGVTVVRSVPLKFNSREKSKIVDEHTIEQLRSGNYNVLPRASLSMSTMSKADGRVMNKNNKINKNNNQFSFNSVPYDFTFELMVMCRGMNEATQIVEQLVPKFNPTINMDVWDVQNLSTPTRIPVRLLDVSIETDEYDELSSNIVSVSFGIGLIGNLYPPINTVARIKSFKMNINETLSSNNDFVRKRIENWDVTQTVGSLVNHTSVEVENTTTYPPVIIDIVSSSPVVIGDNVFTVIYDDKDNTLTELIFTWNIIQGNSATIKSSTLDIATINISNSGITEIAVSISDIHGNSATLSKVFTI